MYRPSGGRGMPSLFKSSQGISRLVMEEVNDTLVAGFKRKAWHEAAIIDGRTLE